MTTTYFEAPDGHGESTLWAVDGNRHAVPAMRQRDVTPGAWPDVVARMTGTTITNDDATVTTIAQAIWASEWFLDWPYDLSDDQRAEAAVYEPTARAVLAALTGVPHDR